MFVSFAREFDETIHGWYSSQFLPMYAPLQQYMKILYPSTHKRLGPHVSSLIPHFSKWIVFLEAVDNTASKNAIDNTCKSRMLSISSYIYYLYQNMDLLIIEEEKE